MKKVYLRSYSLPRCQISKSYLAVATLLVNALKSNYGRRYFKAPLVTWPYMQN